MQINAPMWHLNLQCPCCGQGQPVLVACNACGHVAAECGEVGTFFSDISRMPHLQPSNHSRCAVCGREGREAFGPASAQQIQSAGIQPGQYQ